MVRVGFHDVPFPAAVALGAVGGPIRKTDIVRTGSGAEVRRARWSGSLRRWDISLGIRNFAEAEEVLSFFEAREGRRHAFPFGDPLDHSSAVGGIAPSPIDQVIGTGDGVQTTFALTKRYGGVTRPIELARIGSVRVAIDGVETQSFSLVRERNAVVFDTPPPAGAAVSAGFLFDTPARFEDDSLRLQLGAKGASVPAIGLVEVRL
ncbi:DUF2460 domain-containing protein [Parvularcula lutaonensis]|uniref:TIGR02217 family protein n=1 Tax=Parvularcula lutaonensis TaxID=491923 RepID=A0ABV7MF22_9PROT|nr:DUF2460 domain-containing protein [Parvularcula lutaonensis]GGY53227.1 glycoside hydrolase family 24 [Parvularcula lutaonensis]